MMMFGRMLATFCVMVFLTGCGARVIPVQGHVEDITRFPQDLFAYIDKVDLHKPILSEEEHRAADERSTRLFYRPWHVAKSSISQKDAFMMLGTDPATAKPRGTSSNLLPWTAKAWQALVSNAEAGIYPSMRQKAITIRPTALRGAPTLHPRFGDPEKAGQGYPFDMFQTSAIPLAMPLFVTHQSRDGAWFYAETALASGWVQAHDMAFVDDAFCRDFEARALVVLAADSLGIFDASGRFLTEGHMGTFLPHASSVFSSASSASASSAPSASSSASASRSTGVHSASAGTHSAFEVLVPVRKVDGFALLVKSYVPASRASMKPYPLTPDTLARLGNSLLDRPYGWGGMYADRDCSSLLRDMFLVCGVWLPRNSAVQAKAWAYVPFDSTDTDAESNTDAKKQQILKQGRPFATLLWLPGHITLYIGEYEGEPAMFHSIWGLRTVNDKKEGRHVLGRVVITSTQPGLELPNMGENAELLQRMRGMSVLEK